MGVTQVAFDIPPAIQLGLDAGTLIRYGGVVRDQAGHIVKHLKEVPIVENNEGVIKSVMRFAKKNKYALIIGTAITAVAGGITYIIYKNKKGEDVKIPKCVDDFNTALMKYVGAIRKGKVSETDIDRVLATLTEIKINQKKGRLDGDFSFENAELLLDMIKEYTIRLAAANEYVISENLESKNDNIIDLQTYLNVQKDVFKYSA